MCARYSVTSSYEAIRQLFDLSGPALNLPARYNVAPTQTVPVVRRRAEGGRELVPMRWGFALSWNPKVPLINAQSETAATKKSFSAAFHARRCIVPADGFYEWATLPNGKKQPWRFTVGNGALFGFAGLWEETRLDGQPVTTTTILTTRGNALTTRIHDRMPVILAPESYGLWLGEHAGDLTPLFEPYPAEAMQSYAVDPRVGQVKNDDAGLILPIGPARSPTPIGTLL